VKHAERMAPVAAVASAVATLACCLPLTAAAAATASLGIVVAPYRTWLIGLSLGFLALAFVQMTRATRVCGRQSRISLAIFWVSVAIVAMVLLFPQVVAALLADWLP